jgi:NADH-quinone oxidoreductase subunit L
MTLHSLLQPLGLCVVACPTLLLAVLGPTCLVGRPLSERNIARCTQAAVVTGLLAALSILALMLALGTRHVAIELGNWVSVPEEHFHFHLKFIFDRLSVPFAILSFVLCGTVGAFASKYLHREQGFARFFVLYSLFLLGMVASSLAGTIETLFLGWELVGVSSALLVAYFHERQAPVRNGLRVWGVYRVADAAFLVAAVALHHLKGAGDFDLMLGTGVWPEGHAALTAGQALFVGSLLLVAAAGKSGLIPFSGWLPRAMEGPTPSSAIFYGALSVHLGAFLLLRVSPILELSTTLAAAVVLLGLVSAVFGAMASRVQTDVKSALAFASLTQVGIITAEIGALSLFEAVPHWLYYVPLIHIIGHACLRTLQLLRAPTLLRDYHTLENAIGAHLPQAPGFWSQRLPQPVRLWLYRFALERGYLDALLNEWVIHPFVKLFRWCDGMERRWTDLLSGRASRESDLVQPAAEGMEELP